MWKPFDRSADWLLNDVNGETITTHYLALLAGSDACSWNINLQGELNFLQWTDIGAFIQSSGSFVEKTETIIAKSYVTGSSVQ